VNIILFEERELNNPGAGRLAKRDPRAVHLIKVLRKKPGDRFAAGVTGARRGAGTITGVDRDGTVRFTLDLDEDPPPRLPLHIGVGLNRPIQLRRILRGLSNLGCAAISVFGTDSGEKSYGNSRLLEDGGAAAALLEGAVQARDTLLPLLKTHRNVAAFLADVRAENPPGGRDAGGPEAEDCRPYCAAADNIEAEGSFYDIPRRRKKIIVAVGSERGWSGAERALFRQADFRLLSLGGRALRSEVAAIAACAFAASRLSPQNL